MTDSHALCDLVTADDDRETRALEAALAGSGAAFRTLVEPHLPLLYGIATRVARDRSVAEDAVQETLTVAYRGLRRYRPGTSLRAFLCAIAVKRAHTLSRAERRRQRREAVSAEPAALVGPEEAAAWGRTAARVRAALAELPQMRQAAALLRLEGDLGYDEIAQALGTSPGSARVLVHLAMKALRSSLADLVGETA